MPIMDGMTATREIRSFEHVQKAHKATVIALTGLASTSARVEAMSSGADHFLTKPVDFRTLLKLIEDTDLNKRRRSQDEVMSHEK